MPKSEIKKRSKKTTAQQMEIIVQRMEESHILVSGKCHPLDPTKLEKTWDLLVSELNSVPNGARKTKGLWKTVSILILLVSN